MVSREHRYVMQENKYYVKVERLIDQNDFGRRYGPIAQYVRTQLAFAYFCRFFLDPNTI